MREGPLPYGRVHRASVSPAGGAPATARPPGATATAPAPRLSRVMVAMRVTASGLVTSHLVTLVLPAMVGVRGYVF
jgi:hypothetical protein